MSARLFGLLFITGALLLAGCDGGDEAGNLTTPGEGVTRQIAGNWTGKLRQKGLAPFKIAVDIGSDSTGEVAYTGIECGGDWTLDRVQAALPPRYFFTERINEGAGGTCKGTGRVSLSPIQQQSPNEPAYNQINYVFTGGGVTSRGLLHRTDPAHVNAIFKRVGVSPP